MNTTHYVVLTDDRCWGRGATLDEAIKQARRNGSTVTRTGKTRDYICYEFGDDVDHESLYVDQLGRVNWKRVSEDVDGEPLASWIHEAGKRKPLDGGAA